MAHHDDLLALARLMVDRPLPAPSEAELRRAVSTAYYALFHLLISESTVRLVVTPSIRTRVARTFEHKYMRAVCQDYLPFQPHAPGEHRHPKTGEVVPSQLVQIAMAFETLQEARHRADYDLAMPLTLLEASSHVTLAEGAFRDWLLIESHPAANAFLAELWCRGMPKR
jgi:hypothetical protein